MEDWRLARQEAALNMIDLAMFADVRVNPDIGTICWPSGADLDPDVLYAAVTGEAIPEFEVGPVKTS